MKSLALFLWWMGAAGFVCLVPPAAIAQVSADGTLSTTVNSTDGRNFTLENGDRSGGNLFHSLRELSVPTGGSVFFNNAIDVQNIFTRVTGNSVSNIDGLLRANGQANLFLLNPNGIVFGASGKLDIGGSFIGSTGSRIRFADGVEFTTDPATPSLLTVSTPVGLRIDQNPGSITVNNQPSAGLPDFQNLGLSVKAGQSLLLVGGNITLNGGRLASLGGRVELDALAEPGWVGLSRVGSFFYGEMPKGVERASVLLRQGSLVAAIAPTPISSIAIQARTLRLSQGSNILAGLTDLIPSGFRAGDIDVDVTQNITLINSNIYAAVGPGAIGTAGSINLRANNLRLSQSARISASTLGQGVAGNVNITADRVTVDGTGSRLLDAVATGIYTFILPTGVGDAGDINIRTGDLAVVNGGQISGSTAGRGDGGNVNVTATRRILVEGLTPGFIGINSAITSTVEVGGVGNGGSINLTTPLLRISTGSVSGQTLAQGNGGNVNLQVDRLEALAGGQVAAVSQSVGNSGTININASDRIFLTGSDPTYEARAGFIGTYSAPGGANSGIYANTTQNSTGNGGSINLRTNQLTVAANGTVSASQARARGTSTSGAGNIAIAANQINLSGNAQLTAEATTGDRGNIDVQAGTILMNQSRITTTATETASGGDITLNADFLIGADNSDLIARAQRGRGGNIAITADSILGLKPSDELTDGNDINASSQLGLNGTIAINTLSIDANAGLIKLPGELVDASQQIANACAATQDNRFIITGRGGLPANPSMLTGDRPWSDLRDLSEFGQINPPISRTEAPVQEATQWQVNPLGQVELIATLAASAQHRAALETHLASTCAGTNYARTN